MEKGQGLRLLGALVGLALSAVMLFAGDHSAMPHLTLPNEELRLKLLAASEREDQPVVQDR